MIRAAIVFLMISSAPAAAAPAGSPDLLPLHEVVKIVAGRFQGRLLGARIDSPEPFEFVSGTDIVQELKLLSPQGNIIVIRLDGMTGRVLDARGRGLTEARAPMEEPD